MDKPKLGLATTRELLAELTARIEVDGNLDYRTVEGLASGNMITEAGTIIAMDSEGNVVEDAPERVLPEGKRVVRTKSSGDRVYLLDEEKKTRRWVTNADVLKGLGFEMSDVTEVEDQELLGYNMAAALYRVENADS